MLAEEVRQRKRNNSDNIIYEMPNDVRISEHHYCLPRSQFCKIKVDLDRRGIILYWMRRVSVPCGRDSLNASLTNKNYKATRQAKGVT